MSANSAEECTSGLPDAPNTWAYSRQGFYQQWKPGAFGDRETIDSVERYRVHDDDWHVDSNDVPWRTIHRAEVLA